MSQPDYDIKESRLDGLTSVEINRWFERGSSKIGQMTRIEVFLSRLLSLELYIREYMQLDDEKLQAIKFHRDRVVSLDSDDEFTENRSIQQNDRQEFQNLA